MSAMRLSARCEGRPDELGGRDTGTEGGKEGIGGCSTIVDIAGGIDAGVVYENAGDVFM